MTGRSGTTTAKTPRGVLYVSNRKPYRLVSLGQAPEGMDPSVLRQWLSAWQKARRGGIGSIRGYELQVLAASGDVLGEFDLGTDLGPDPSTRS